MNVININSNLPDFYKRKHRENNYKSKKPEHKKEMSFKDYLEIAKNK